MHVLTVFKCVQPYKRSVYMNEQGRGKENINVMHNCFPILDSMCMCGICNEFSTDFSNDCCFLILCNVDRRVRMLVIIDRNTILYKQHSI